MIEQLAKSQNMPQERNFEWNLKSTSTTHFGIHKRDNGQFCVVLNHSLLRGVRSEMIYWWFQNFTNTQVTLKDVENFENQTVPAYLLWHPSDHINARLLSKSAPYNIAKAGDKIHIQEVMQYKKYQWKYSVDKKLNIFYCAPEGWATGIKIPFLGEAMILRIHYKDVVENNEIIGVQYHYEVVMGVSGNNFLAKTFNKILTKELSTDFFKAWHLHNTIEVGTFENFLPALYEQRETGNYSYSKSMNNQKTSDNNQRGFSKEFFEQRFNGYKKASNPFRYQAYEKESFL